MTREIQSLQPQDHFFSFDLGLTSALVLLEYDLVAIDKANRANAQFVFRRKEGIDEDIQRYWAGVLSVSARHLFDAQKMLKNRLYSD